MIISIVIALAIFFWGIPIAICLFLALWKAASALFTGIMEGCFTVLDGVAYAIGWMIRCAMYVYRAVRAQVQNFG